MPKLEDGSKLLHAGRTALGFYVEIWEAPDGDCFVCFHHDDPRMLVAFAEYAAEVADAEIVGELPKIRVQ